MIFVSILAAEQTFHSADWYQGTADAVRKQLFEIKATGAEEIVILVEESSAGGNAGVSRGGARVGLAAR